MNAMKDDDEKKKIKRLIYLKAGSPEMLRNKMRKSLRCDFASFALISGVKHVNIKLLSLLYFFLLNLQSSDLTLLDYLPLYVIYLDDCYQLTRGQILNFQ
jgi:hypothetical protein